ncbi:SNF2-related protein [Neolewinella lacunae]|uniref:ATP-dependent helicase n=1 Tax=Neolewinella lacunae TaxID=1517758 RepID=A0A923PJQ3_9BACT|nr:SNF2-related protein [Neolewinella lacunae]MBC6994589.1 ATP-dependent helicase [Neolewinella lacunae]MDN3634461.1 SNF2-related protein [Neolewinella lacunae]
MSLTPEILFDFFEYRTGIYLPKAYVVGRNEVGRLAHVHHTANARELGVYDITLTPPLERALALVEGLRHQNVAEAHRKGAKIMPTLAGLLSDKSKERSNVIRYIHHRSAEVLSLCQQHGWAVSVGLDPRKEPEPFVTPFAPVPYQPRLTFHLSDAGLDFRLELEAHDGQRSPVRHHDIKILTNHPTPGWLVLDKQLTQLGQLNGSHLKPFLSKDLVHLEGAEVGKFWRDYIVRVAEHNPIVAHGFQYAVFAEPEVLRLAARPHPFEGRFYLYPEFGYGGKFFAVGAAEATAVVHNLKPPYRLARIVRNPAAEEALLQPLLALGVSALPVGNAFRTPEDDAFAAPRWLLENEVELRALGIEVVPPEENGQRISAYQGTISLEMEAENDWLDLHGTVVIGPHEIPFHKFVRYIQREERRFPLPDGDLFLIPDEWFARYRPSLQFARVEGKKVRLARSQAPLLAPLGLGGADTEQAQRLAEAFAPSARLHATLRPYQLEGARWLVRHYHEQLGACLADDMGLGKTLQTIAALLYAKERVGADAGATEAPKSKGGPASQLDLFAAPAADEQFLQPLRALVVLPASLVFNWRNELARFAPSLTVETHTGQHRTRDARVLRRFDVLLTTYQTALRDVSVLREIDFTYIILDESQQIKNRQSKVFKALNELHAPHRISLSGTPIENSLSDLWSQMQFINPGLLRHYAFFKQEFITPIEVHNDEARKSQLRQLVGPHLLRRTKEEVAPDLPELDVQLYYCEMSGAQRKAYESEKSAARNALLGNFAPNDGQYQLRVVQTLTRLRQLANHPVLLEEDYDKSSGKFDEVLGQWNTVRRAGHKVLIFSSMVRHLELFREELRANNEPFAWITGQVDAKTRAREVRRFQEDPTVQTFFISIKAGGTGLNLTAADYVFILDPWWNPSIEDQAIARAHRIGRQGNVFARKFLTKDSIEEKINRLQQRKKQLADDIIGTEGGLDFDRGELEFLLT